MMDEVWLMLAQAEFHKGEFLESIGTFNYVAKQYKLDKDVVARCQLWVTRAYAELGWIYEAEQVLLTVKQDELRRENSQFYAITNADLLLRKKQYREAIPFLQLAEATEKNKYQKTRFNFILGQLHQLMGNNREAHEAYTRVIKANPAFEMNFNAHINQTQMNSNKTEALKSLQRMSRQYKYKDNLDQIHGAIGNIYLSQADTTNAIRSYNTAIKESTKNGFEKAEVLVTLGDLHYNCRNYGDAQPCFSEASQIVLATDDDYARISKLAETLNELNQHHEIVVLQDSLLHLSTLNEKEQLAVAQKIIADLEEAERLATEEAERKKLSGEDEGPQGVNTQNMIGGGGSNKWYFYNTNLVRSGKTEFTKKWGQRKLEDNWRRASKTLSSNLAVMDNTEGDISAANDNSEVKTTGDKTKDPQFYLNQIPHTEEQIAHAHQEVATGLYNMGYVYKDKIEDATMAQATFDELERRYPQDERMVEVYYVRHLMALQNNDAALAENHRKELISKFPESKHAQTLKYPDYAQRIVEMNAQQDSLYESTYKAYLASDFTTVGTNKELAEVNYPLSPLLPKFYFLNALAVGKTQDPMTFGDTLREMVEKYPDSDVSAMAKDMLALMNQGAESKKGQTHGTLLAKRDEEVAQTTKDSDAPLCFSNEKQTASACLLITDAEEKDLNNLLYQVAFYNFSNFLIKEYDMNIMPLGENTSALKVSNFTSYDEAGWYEDRLLKDTALKLLFKELNVKIVRITEENIKLLYGTFTLEEYEAFQLGL